MTAVPVAAAACAASYTNAGVVSSDGDVYVWGGAAWKGGYGAGHSEATQVTWSEGLSGVPQCYQCEDLAVGHRHVMLVFKNRDFN